MNLFNYYMYALTSPLNFKGRACRTEYFTFSITNTIFLLLIILSSLPIGYLALVSLILFLPSLSIAVRRLHDIDKSGWFILLGFIPIVSIVLLLFMFKPSTEGRNSFGGLYYDGLVSLPELVKRLHHNDKSGGFILLGFIPIMSSEVLELMFKAKPEARNSYENIYYEFLSKK